MTDDGLRRVAAAIGRVVDRIRAGVPDAERDAAAYVAPRLAGRARGSSRQSMRVAGAVRSDGPRVEVGGSVVAGGELTPAADLFYGANFGAKQYPQFRWPMQGRDYWFFSGIRAEEDALGDVWASVVDDAIEGA